MLNIDRLFSDYKTPDGIIKMINSLDIITLNHSVRVCEIAKIVEKDIGLSGTILSETGLYHDIGKYFVSSKILDKRGKLTDIERAIIDFHSYISYKVLKFYNIDNVICEIALYHHSFEPSMYFDDDKKAIKDIDPFVTKLAQILKTIDMFEAITTDRPYHRGISGEAAIKIILDTNGCDLATIEILKNHIKELE